MEVLTKDRSGFGRYQFWVVGRVDRLDPNVVFGLFNYPTPDIGPDGTNEIDIEFAKWGKPEAPMGNYTVWSTANRVAAQPDGSDRITLLASRRRSRSGVATGQAAERARQKDGKNE